MIEVPRGALTADEIAQTAEFFSFGTNDLTQTALGMRRDDSGSFLPPYAELEIVKKNPFATIDPTGVGQLMRDRASRRAASRAPDIKLGICGEHGGDPASVKFCHEARPQLRELLAVPRAGRPPRRGAGGAAMAGRLTTRRSRYRSVPPKLGISRTGRSVIKVFKHENGTTTCVDAVDPAWLKPGQRRLRLGRHGRTRRRPRAVCSRTSSTSTSSPSRTRSARSTIPKIESYGDYLYLILHGIDFQAAAAPLQDQGRRLLPRRRSSWSPCITDMSRSIEQARPASASATTSCSAKGTAALMHRIVDTMVDNYRPEVDKLEERLDKLETDVFEQPEPEAGAADPRLQAGRLVAAPGRAAAARRGRPAGTARVSARSPSSSPTASATCTTTWSGSRTRRCSSRIASPASSTRICRRCRIS